MIKQNCVIVIPSLNPDVKLITYVEELKAKGFEDIIVVDDGSCDECKKIFTTLNEQFGCKVIVHAVNMGKGRALKNAFNFYLNNYSDKEGVVTVDSDGQHVVSDVISVCNELHKYQQSLILGVRDFNSEVVPFKSRFGNKMTIIVMKVLIGGHISDTQTGLRGIPNSLIKKYLTLYGERFEYETIMLIESINQQIPVKEVKITTVYIDNNSETHFNPIKDSIAIYKLIFASFLKYVVASLSSFLIDYGLFIVILGALSKSSDEKRILIATIVARIVSSLYNFVINRNAVFRSKNNINISMAKYYVLCICQMMCSAYMVLIGVKFCGGHESVIKLIIDSGLFIISYQIQRKWIFR